MSAHVTTEELARFRTGGLDAAEVERVATHLHECAACGAAARGSQDPDAVAAGFERLLAEDEAAVAEWPRRRVVVAAAILAAAAVVLAFLILPMRRGPIAPPRRAPIEQPAGYGRQDWDQLVRAARGSGRVEVAPVLRELRGEAESLRTIGDPAHGQFAPVGTVVESDRPRFSWTADNRKATYFVNVYEGNRRVAHSASLRAGEWTPDASLERGKTYQWQVEVREGDASRFLPAPPARFRVMPPEEEAQLAEARRRFPSDHLLIGLLAARFGAIDEARRELAAANAGDLLRSLD